MLGAAAHGVKNASRMICARGLVYDAGMRRNISILIVMSSAALLALGQAPAQTAAVPVTGEPHHHLVYSDENVRAFHVEVPAHSSTMLHQHDVDYIWLALGDADVINAVAGKPEARLQIKDGIVHFTRGGFAHVARNESNSGFRNVTIELLKPQKNPRNRCEGVMPGAAGMMICERPRPGHLYGYIGAEASEAFATDQMRVFRLQVAAGGKMKVGKSKTSRVLVVSEGTEAQALVSIPVAGGATGKGTRDLRSGDIVACPPKMAVEIRNPGKSPAQFLALEFKNAKN
jgi:mannose-6-phosphate isomerase-like protein (cupin superfamily)